MERSSTGAIGADAQEAKAITDKIHAKEHTILFMMFSPFLRYFRLNCIRS